MSFKVTDRQLRKLLAKFPSPQKYRSETGESTKRVYFVPITEFRYQDQPADTVQACYVDGRIGPDYGAPGELAWTLEFFT